MFINRVIGTRPCSLVYVLSVAAFILQGHSWVVVTEIVWPNMSIMGIFTEDFSRPLIEKALLFLMPLLGVVCLTLISCSVDRWLLLCPSAKCVSSSLESLEQEWQIWCAFPTAAFRAHGLCSHSVMVWFFCWAWAPLRIYLNPVLQAVTTNR